MYKDTRLTWLGDSTARRASMTMSKMLLGDRTVKLLSDPRIIDINKKRAVEHCDAWTANETRPQGFYNGALCRPMPDGSGGRQSLQDRGAFNYVRRNCFNEVRDFLTSETDAFSRKSDFVFEALPAPAVANTTDPDSKRNTTTRKIGSFFARLPSDVLVIGTGIWEMDRARDCRAGEGNRTMAERLDQMVAAASNFSAQTRTAVVFRTSGFTESEIATPGDKTTRSSKKTLATMSMNQQLLKKIEQTANPLVTAVDWASAVLARSGSGIRIRGDLKAHYGLEPRLVMMQMLTNHLIDQGILSPERIIGSGGGSNSSSRASNNNDEVEQS